MKSTWHDCLVNLTEVNNDGLELEQCNNEFMSFLIAEDEWDTWEEEGF